MSEPAFYRDIIQKDDVIICADSGYLNAAKINVTPHWVIGDFDSSEKADVPQNCNIRVLPVEKDRTDLHECILHAIRLGADRILLFGARGTRLDHSLAAISLLYMGLSMGVDIGLIDEHNEMFLFANEVHIPKRAGYKLSLLPLTKVTGIYTKGLYYALSDAEMDWGNPYGVSNEFTEDEAHISIKSGVMMVSLSRD